MKNRDAEHLLEILNSMDIPEMRRDLNTTNLRWLLRNIRVRNSKNPMLGVAFTLIKKIIKERIRNSIN